MKKSTKIQKIRFNCFNEIEQSLKRQKTIQTTQLTELDESILKICPETEDNNDAKDSFENLIKLSQKISRELYQRIKVNNYHLTFDEFKVLANKTCNLLWIYEPITILVPIKKPAGMKLSTSNLPFGFNHVMIPEALQNDAFDVFESVRVDKRILSSSKLSEICEKLCREAITSLVDFNPQVIKIRESSVNNRCLEVILECNSSYLSQTSDETETKKVKRLSQKELILNLKFVSAITINSQQKSYLTTDKNDSSQTLHAFYPEIWWKSIKILEKTTLADRGNRLKALIGLYKLLKSNPTTEFITQIHLVHILLNLLDNELDDNIKLQQKIPWQRKYIYLCFLDQLQQLKLKLKFKRIDNHFLYSSNLIDLSDEAKIKQCQDADIYLEILCSSKIKLIKALNDVENEFLNSD